MSVTHRCNPSVRRKVEETAGFKFTASSSGLNLELCFEFRGEGCLNNKRFCYLPTPIYGRKKILPSVECTKPLNLTQVVNCSMKLVNAG
ncbi:hypothetical protein Q8A67_015632 [Cirrhinus molitorella]|uniref:Uncharacterized protein n=1 Tax=Cirrhinus molitorella TaxID=172907 RepID=A0AA88TJ04_9TELE|nr:hypothetical protein Q8A67_015632 [Cirrhinus molitorella]